MKKILLPVAALLFAGFAACGDTQPSKDAGQEQVPEPVLNSGPGTEAQRATQAVRDSIVRDTGGQSDRSVSDSMRPR